MKNLTQKIKRQICVQSHWKVYAATDPMAWSQIFEIKAPVYHQISRHLFYQIRIHIERLKIGNKNRTNMQPNSYGIA